MVIKEIGKRVVLIVPCFNEEEALLHTFNALEKVFNDLINTTTIKKNSRLIFIDDGSRDATWDIIQELNRSNSFVEGIKLSRNFGHQNALLAGLLETNSQYDLYITLDADLQDDPLVIPNMIEAYTKGAEIVYAVRSNRNKDSYFKQFTAQSFYKIMRWLKVPITPQHADFRLISKAVLEELSQFEERNLFLRGIFPSLGFPTATVEYQRNAREYGKTKYPFKKMSAFAWDGITSFSIYPVRLILYIGVLTFLLSFCLGSWVIYTYLIGKAVPGWSSIVLPISAFGGLQMISLGIIGEYLGKIYQEVKKRPRYIVEKRVGS